MLNSFTTFKNDQIDSIAIGGFDGIHKAHQYLISKLSKNSLVLIIDKKNASLTPGKIRCKYIKTDVHFLDYEEIKELIPNEFVNLLMNNFKNLKKIVVGYDFRFGKDRSGDTILLKKLFYGEVEVVKQFKINSIAVHSRVIKDFIKQKEIKKANDLLGRRYSIEGEVIKGLGLGKKELFATLNLRVKEFLIPPNGVYATFTKIQNEVFPSVTFIGNRLSVDGNFSIETHLIDHVVDEDVKSLEVSFVKFLRENQKFATLSELKKQILHDICEAKGFLLTSF